MNSKESWRKSFDGRIQTTHEKIVSIEKECDKLHGWDKQNTLIVDYAHVQLIHVCPICKNKVNVVLEDFRRHL